jgi:hypothetical protein
MTIIRVEEGEARLSAVEAELGLRQSDVARLRRSIHDTVRVPSPGFVGDDRFGETLGVDIPTSRSFYDAGLEEAVARLYAPDVERYGYGFPAR